MAIERNLRPPMALAVGSSSRTTVTTTASMSFQDDNKNWGRQFYLWDSSVANSCSPAVDALCQHFDR